LLSVETSAAITPQQSPSDPRADAFEVDLDGSRFESWRDCALDDFVIVDHDRRVRSVRSR
jgi:hypothetical protein